MNFANFLQGGFRLRGVPASQDNLPAGVAGDVSCGGKANARISSRDDDRLHIANPANTCAVGLRPATVILLPRFELRARSFSQVACNDAGAAWPKADRTRA